MVYKRFKEYFLQIIFVSVFILIYIIFLIYFYIIPYDRIVSPVLMIGFIIIIISIFIFINLKNLNDNTNLFSFKFLPENSIKIVLILIIGFCIIITPISYPQSIILWEKVSFFSYVRAIGMIIGCAFLPGACIFNIFFHNNKLQQRFKVESFLIKIVFYPLLSFSFIGISVLIIDQIGIVNRNLFTYLLFLIILCLFIVDIIMQKRRTELFKFKNETINISKFTSLISLTSIGIICITVGVHLGIHFIIPGDSWAALTFTKNIGDPYSSALEKGRASYNYPIFWCYIIYGFSILGGLPIINTNTLLIPFNYLFILAVYLLMKAILLNMKEKYAVLSTLLISIFSALFYITASSIRGSLPAILFACTFYFIYKSYALILFIISLALFIIISKTKNEKDENNSLSLFKFRDVKLIFLISFFLIISFMVYGLPFLMGLIFIFLYCLSAEKFLRNIQLFSHVILFNAIIFIIFDLVMEFYLSSAAFNIFYWFFQFLAFIYIAALFPTFIIVYTFLAGLFIVIILIEIIYFKHFKERKRSFLNITINPKKIFKVSLVIFTIFLIIEIMSIILEEVFLGYYLEEKIIFFYYLDQIYLNIGFIGIIATYVSYYCFRKNKKLFFILIVWIIISFLIASVLFIINVIKYRAIFIRDVDNLEFFTMNLWFSRIWSYVIIPICIIFSIGIIKFIKDLKIHQKFKNIFTDKKKKNLIKTVSFLLLIYLSYSNLIITGISIGNARNRVNKEEVELISWMSEHLPHDSSVLIESDYFIQLGIFSMTHAEFRYISDFFKSDDTEAEMIEERNNLQDDKIQYILLTRDFLRDDGDVSIFFRSYLIPYFYNESEYKSDNYRIYYAPYFD